MDLENLDHTGIQFYNTCKIVQSNISCVGFKLDHVIISYVPKYIIGKMNNELTSYCGVE